MGGKEVMDGLRWINKEEKRESDGLWAKGGCLSKNYYVRTPPELIH